MLVRLSCSTRQQPGQSLTLSFCSPSYFPSFSKQAKQKTKLRFADTDPVQDAGPTLALESAFRTKLELLRRGALWQDVEEIVSEQTKTSLHHWISESKPAAASFAWVCRLASHWVTVDGPITTLKWTWHCRRPQNRTENFVRFEAGRTEHSDGFWERCAIIFRLSHPAAACFRRSFRNSVCKTFLVTIATENVDFMDFTDTIPENNRVLPILHKLQVDWDKVKSL